MAIIIKINFLEPLKGVRHSQQPESSDCSISFMFLVGFQIMDLEKEEECNKSYST